MKRWLGLLGILLMGCEGLATGTVIATDGLPLTHTATLTPIVEISPTGASQTPDLATATKSGITQAPSLTPSMTATALATVSRGSQTPTRVVGDCTPGPIQTCSNVSDLRYLYTIRAGDTLVRIGALCKVDWLEIAGHNGLDAPYPITAGAILWIPGVEVCD